MRRFGIDHTVKAVDQAQKDQTLEVDEAFRPLPPATGPAPYRLELSEVVSGLSPLARTLHIIGDTGGIANPVPQQEVIKAMIADLANGVEACYHVGDWAYFESEEQAWVTQVFEAYAAYNRALLGISGNHDAFSYANFMRYLGSQKPELLPETAEFHRDTMTQPNAYFTTIDPLVTIIGLATNVPSGGVVKADQEEWLIGELKSAPTDRALIVALHHPPYSCDAHHGGSAAMGEVLDNAFAAAERFPDLVLSGHVHDTQVFTRTVQVPDGNNGPYQCKVTYAVVGNSGYHNLHALADEATPGMEVAEGLTFDYGDASEWGFMRLTITTVAIAGEYIGVSREGIVTPGKYAFSIPIGG